MWNSAYLPLSTNTLFDRFGSGYSVSSVTNPDGSLNVAAYQQYSPVFLPVTVVITYIVLMMLATACLMHTALFYGPQIYKSIKNIRTAQTDIHAKLMLAYKEVPAWWYGITFVSFMAMSMAASAVSSP